MSAKRHYSITSEQNDTFRLFKDLLATSGILKHKQAFIFGEKAVIETLSKFPGQCVGLVINAHGSEENKNRDRLLCEDRDLTVYDVAGELYRQLDMFKSHFPVLLVKAPEIPVWSSTEKIHGCNLFLTLQEPSNLGGVIRSAVAFGVKNVILGKGCANPFHPKSSRAASGTLFGLKFFKADALDAVDFASHSTVALDMRGEDIATFKWPKDFILVCGEEGRGIDKTFIPKHRVNIEISKDIESLNAMVATSIALHRYASQNVG